MIQKLFRVLCVLGWMFCLLSRMDLFQSYGKGTGTNKLSFSPLDVSCYFLTANARIRGGETAINGVRNVCQVIGVPGVVYHSFPNVPSVPNVLEESNKWTKSTNMKRITKNGKDQISGFISLACVLCLFFAFVYPKEASLFFVCCMVALQVALKSNEPSIRIDEQWGFYSIGMAVVGYLLN